MNKSENGFGVIGIIILIATVAMVGAAGWFVYDRQNTKESDTQPAQSIIDESTAEETAETQAESNKNIETETEHTLSEGTFAQNSEQEFLGNFEAKGYIEIKELDEAFCETNCAKQKVAYFVIKETANTNVENYFTSLNGNTFVGDNSFAIGCVIDNVVIGRVDFSNSESTELLASNIDNTLVLDFNRTTVPPARGVDNCWSHFDEISII